MISQIKLQWSNAYLIRGNRAILVDTGSTGEENKIRQKLSHLGVSISDLSLILHSHVHSDHVGSTATLCKETKLPITYHQADEPLATRANNGVLKGTSLEGRLMAKFFNHTPFTMPRPDFYLEDEMRLDKYGVTGRIVHTPGHTSGSISVVLDHGEAIIGDLLMGGYMGGNLWPSRPNLHYFAQNLAQARQSLERLLSQEIHTFYVGHGGPLQADDVRLSMKRMF